MGEAWLNFRRATDPNYAREDAEKKRRETCHENWARARDERQEIFDRANDAGNYNSNAHQSKNDIGWYKDDGDKIAKRADAEVAAALSISQDARTKANAIKKEANEQKAKIAETQEERDTFDSFVSVAEATATSAENAYRDAVAAATHAHVKVGQIDGIDQANPIVDQGSYKTRGIKEWERIFPFLECQPPCNNGRGGMTHMESQADDAGSNILRQDFINTRDKVKGYMNTVKDYADGFWTIRESARVIYDKIDGERADAVEKKGDAQGFLKTLNESAGAVMEFSKSHDYGYLTDQIDLIQLEIERVETKKKDIDQPPYDRDYLIQQQYDASMVAYKARLKTESEKNPFDSATLRMQELTKELKDCSDNVTTINRRIAELNTQIAVMAQNIINKEPDVDNARNKRDNRFSDLLNIKITHADLSGQLISKLEEKDKLQKSLTIEEQTYAQLLQQIEKLKLDIIYWTQKNYSNTVYNSQNLLNLSEKIDHNLQHIFSDLKTQNINPHLLHTKIHYREIEKQKLTNTDKILDTLFYCFYVSFIIIMIVTRNINAEHFVFYIFIGLIPFLYPFVFKNANYLIHSFKIDGPKNAFIESDENDENNKNMIHAYNI
jgi:uncharacterized protein (UPF0335 family)